MKKKILKKALPVLLAAAVMLVLGLVLRLGTESVLGKGASYMLVLAAVVMFTVVGNPFEKVRKQLEEPGYTQEILESDLEKGFSCKNMDVGTQFLVSYGLFTKIIPFGDVLWMYIDTESVLHFIMKDKRELLAKAESPEEGGMIAKQMEKSYPWIIFGYLEEIEKLKNENFDDLEQLYKRKMFQCVVDGKLPESYPYPSSKPKQEEPKQEEEKAVPYPEIPEIGLDDVRIPDSGLSDYFREMTELCREYGSEFSYTFHAPVREKDIIVFEKRHRLKLPKELKELLMFSNGFSLDYDDFYGLEEISFHFDSWGALKDDDGNEYIMIADVVGDGESIVFSRETGVFYWEDHGEFTEYGGIGDVLEDRIEFLKDMIGAE